MILNLTQPHPGNASIVKVDVQQLDLLGNRVFFRWLDAQGQPVDSGNSSLPFTPAGFPITDAEIVAAIESGPS